MPVLKQRLLLCVLAIGLCVPAANGQWLETTIPLPDTMPELLYLSSLLYHPANKTIYVGGADTFLFAVDAKAGAKLARVKVGVGPHVLCSDVPGNKVYCADKFWTFNVIDGGTNRVTKTLPIEHDVTDMVYVEPENKLYCANATDTLLQVMDCAGDSVVARIRVNFGPGALCYNRPLNRIYCAHESTDVVTVVDCAADTVVAVIPVGGDGPGHVCYDSATNAVYTANVSSRTVSVIDCAGDTLVRVVAVGRGPDGITAGPPGKVYCTNSSDRSVSVISDSGVKVVRTGLYPHMPTYDPMNKKVYCANAGDGSVSVVDAATDTAFPGVGTGRYPAALCLNPAGNSVWAASINDHLVSVIDGVSGAFRTAIPFQRSHPSLLGYNPTSDRLYCLDDLGLVTVLDGNTNAILRALFVGWRAFAGFVWNPLRNKLHFSAPSMDAVYVVDCTSDRIAARVPVGYPTSLCYNSANDRVYVGRGDDTLLAVIDCARDSVIRTLPMPGHSEQLAYNRISNKIYCLQQFAGAMIVLDGTTDTVVATVPLPERCFLPCFIPPHNKLYVGSDDNPDIQVVDGAGDSLIETIALPFPTESLFYDLANDRVYVTLRDSGLNVYDAGSDTLVASLPIAWPSTPPRDNGRFGDANLVYCASQDSVRVISGTADTIIRSIPVGRNPVSLAWNPARSWLYVANNIGASISVLSDTSLTGIEENLTRITGRRLQPTIVRGVLFLPEAPGLERKAASLLDISGRDVLDLHPGANDVRALAPGVYFVRPEPSAVSRRLSPRLS
jgi:YVTN family beta-propeller protein